MFKNVFSFEGRIRRMEYGISIISFFLINFSISGLLDSTEFLNSLYFFIFIPSYWMLLAQSAKRCHDMGTNGFYQLIPFYFIGMAFIEGQKGVNKYGLNPKSAEYKVQKTSILPPLNLEINHLLFSQLLCISLLMLLCLSVGNFFLPSSDLTSILLYFTLPILGFFIVIILDEKTSSIKRVYKQFIYKQFFFSIIYYALARFYMVTFLEAGFSLETILIEFILVLILFGMTYVSVGLHILIFNQNVISNE